MSRSSQHNSHSLKKLSFRRWFNHVSTDNLKKDIPKLVEENKNLPSSENSASLNSTSPVTDCLPSQLSNSISSECNSKHHQGYYGKGKINSFREQLRTGLSKWATKMVISTEAGFANDIAASQMKSKQSLNKTSYNDEKSNKLTLSCYEIFKTSVKDLDTLFENSMRKSSNDEISQFLTVNTNIQPFQDLKYEEITKIDTSFQNLYQVSFGSIENMSITNGEQQANITHGDVLPNKNEQENTQLERKLIRPDIGNASKTVAEPESAEDNGNDNIDSTSDACSDKDSILKTPPEYLSKISRDEINSLEPLSTETESRTANLTKKASVLSSHSSKSLMKNDIEASVKDNLKTKNIYTSDSDCKDSSKTADGASTLLNLICTPDTEDELQNTKPDKYSQIVIDGASQRSIYDKTADCITVTLPTEELGMIRISNLDFSISNPATPQAVNLTSIKPPNNSNILYCWEMELRQYYSGKVLRELLAEAQEQRQHNDVATNCIGEKQNLHTRTAGNELGQMKFHITHFEDEYGNNGAVDCR